LRADFRDHSSWQRTARAKLLELLHYEPAPCQPQAEVVERVEADGYTREKVYFNTTPELRVPAYVLVPKKLERPAPALVALHDHGGYYLWGKEKLVATENEHAHLSKFKEQAYAGRSIASDLARAGYVVVVIDMFYWGERRMLLDDDAADWRQRAQDLTAERINAFNRRSGESEQLVGRTIYSAGFTWAGVMFWDDIRTVDYLVSRPEVDKNRIGCVGLSVGGLRSCHLAALDDRIKAAVVVGWMCSFPRQLKAHVRNTIGHTKLVPGLYRFMDYPDVAALASPAALLVINGSQDGLFEREGVAQAFEKLAACYRKAGTPEKVATRLYDSPHEFNPAMQEEAWAWLRRWV
jgi:dienelactone hydrolase